VRNFLVAIVLFVACGLASAQTSMVGVKAGMTQVYGTIESLKQEQDFAKPQRMPILRMEGDYEHITGLYADRWTSGAKVAIKRRLLDINAVIADLKKVQASDQTTAKLKKLSTQVNAVLALVN